MTESNAVPSEDRVSAAQAALDDETLVCYPGPNTKYFAGIYGEPLDRHLLLAVPPAGDPFFVTPEKSMDLIRDESWIEEARVIPENDPAAVARRLADEVTTNALLVDGRAPYSVTRVLDDASGATLVPADSFLTELRIRKDETEIAALRRSATVADEVSREIRSMGADVVGMTEAELANEIRGRLHAKGGTRLSFPVVVASGPNAARPYVRNSNRTIDAGEPVIVDFGAFVDGNASDQTRTTVFAGDPPDEFEAAYEAVVAAFEAGVEAVEPGVTAGAIDRTVESVVVDRGFEANLIHGTGHGVGLEAHEAPTIGDGNERELEPGMVFSIEPGVYFEGEFGVRVEDLVVVTETGCERLNDSPKGWRPL